MASPQPLLLRPRPPACLCRCPCRSGSPYLHLSKKGLQALRPPRRCRQPVAALVSRPLGTGRCAVVAGTFVCRCSYDTKNGLPTPPSDKEKSLAKWPVLRRWDVPWEWPTISLTMVACAVRYSSSFAQWYRALALPDFKFEEPFKLQNGWLLWAGIGLIVAIIAIALAGATMTFLNGETPQRETDSLIILLPLIGSSGIRTACLLGITGVWRQFLRKRFSTPYAVLITAAVFAFAHLTPGEFPQLFALGVVLGFSYAQTRNLLTPITIHAVWNSGVILLLTFLQLQGYDIKELLQVS
ncbi:hypothetical protein HU200_003027 [Digitaria exilis]|uniref:CAAX prenyl protease 2/Lysostaphin resistance protein A-like domain-containing protein n=1 Tax=Digitaria exilis TaxID=1010633 RepID=A0A835FUJ9_9POAL|nr:hypothetical protein HU200_003027 [Digitaria exilis]